MKPGKLDIFNHINPADVINAFNGLQMLEDTDSDEGLEGIKETILSVDSAIQTDLSKEALYSMSKSPALMRYSKEIQENINKALNSGCHITTYKQSESDLAPQYVKIVKDDKTELILQSVGFFRDVAMSSFGLLGDDGQLLVNDMGVKAFLMGLYDANERDLALILMWAFANRESILVGIAASIYNRNSDIRDKKVLRNARKTLT